MQKSKIRQLLVEQISSNIEDTVNRIKKYTQYWNQLSFEDQKQIGDDPNGVGKEFFSKSEELLNSLKTASEGSPDYLDKNKQDIAKTIFNFKDILSKYPEVYNVAYKDTLDEIANSSFFKPEETSTIPPSTQPQAQPSTTTPTKEEPVKYATDYTGSSLVDFLEKSGQPSDKESRRQLAVKLGIVQKPEDYKFTAEQNTQMLNMLRSGKTEETPTTIDGIGVKKAELAKPYTTPKEGKGPTIKYGKMEYPAYVDMGGGKYRLAYQEELDNPNIQLYIPNPKKGATEYGKPNFVKVRREGSSIRPQSQFGGALGSASNLLGDIGTTLAKPFRK